MKQPFFSVIIPTYNRKPFLEKSITSVLEQSYSNFELLIIDDGSTDNTDELIFSYNDQRIIYIKNNTNQGVAPTRNIGLTTAKGDFIAFLDSDDWWLNNKLERTVEYIEEHPDIAIFHTEETWFRKGKLMNQKTKHKKPSGWVYKNALPLCCVSISTAVIKKSVFDSVGIFDESLEACEDYDFWLRVTNKFEVKLIPEYLTEKDGGRPDQLSSKVWGLDRFRIKALQKMLDSNSISEENYRLTLKELQTKCRIFSTGCRKRGKIEEATHYNNLLLQYSK